MKRDAPPRRLLLGGMAAIAIATVSPAITGHDSFPLSSYPVYASVRGREETFDLAYGLTIDGRRHELSMDELAATDDPLIARSALRRAVEGGRVDVLCAEIATRVDGDVHTIVVVTQTVDVVEVAKGRSGLLDEVEHGRCEVPG